MWGAIPLPALLFKYYCSLAGTSASAQPQALKGQTLSSHTEPQKRPHALLPQMTCTPILAQHCSSTNRGCRALVVQWCRADAFDISCLCHQLPVPGALRHIYGTHHSSHISYQQQQDFLCICVTSTARNRSKALRSTKYVPHKKTRRQSNRTE